MNIKSIANKWILEIQYTISRLTVKIKIILYKWDHVRYLVYPLNFDTLERLANFLAEMLHADDCFVQIPFQPVFKHSMYTLETSS